MTLDILKNKVLGEISREALSKHLNFFCQFDRTSGSEGERKAVDYIAQTARSYGLPVEIHDFLAYLSYPKSSSLYRIEGDRTVESFPSKTRAFSGTTPPSGIQGELIYVPGGKDMFRDFETSKRLEGLDLKGKVVVSEGGGRQNMKIAEDRGAIAYILMWPSPEEQLHEGIVTPIWGMPTPENIKTLSHLPVITISNGNARRLIELAGKEKVRLRLITEVRPGWVTVQLPVATVKGLSEDYVLVAGHLDSWHLGATDNATGNSACLELARLFAPFAGKLRRGIKIAWWPGHSTGRYAGSTWYADQFWQDLHDHCITYINIDSPGCLGATEYRSISAVAENAAFAVDVVREVTGQTTDWERPVRAGDQSFWGPGISSLFMLLSERPVEKQAKVGGSAGGWWWHNEADTIDKVDVEILVKDTQIYGLSLVHLCEGGLIPFRLDHLAEEVSAFIGEITDLAPGFSWGRLSVEVENFKKITQKVEEIKSAVSGKPRKAEILNRGTLGAIKAITVVNYTAKGPFDHDPAVPTLPFPGLQAIKEWVRLEPASDERGFLGAKLIRERNRVSAALVEAIKVLSAALEECSQND